MPAFQGLMKKNGIITGKLVLLLGIGCAVMLASGKEAKANRIPLPASINLTIGDGRELGVVEGNIPPGEGVRRNFVNHLVAMASGTNNQAFGRDFARSNNAFNSLPEAVLAGHVNGTGTTVNLGSGLYTYLFAKYEGDGQHSDSAEVWYVGNLSGVIAIPQTFGGNSLSGWTLFRAGVAGAVPDGGATAMLLGAALGALGVIRRFLNG
jgi:protein with PEP-CTERM/exosortase system signal